jgi:hypothetical protein
VVTPSAAIIRPLDFVPGYVVPDGEPAQQLPKPLRHGGPAVPGPKPGQVWTPAGQGRTERLIGSDGQPTGAVVHLPGDTSGFTASDGHGYLLVPTGGGVYDARPDGLHRITTGSVVASGPTGWLAVREPDPAAAESYDRGGTPGRSADQRSPAFRVGERVGLVTG